MKANKTKQRHEGKKKLRQPDIRFKTNKTKGAGENGKIGLIKTINRETERQTQESREIKGKYKCKKKKTFNN